MIGADTLEMLPTFQCLISMLMLLAQASNHLISTIYIAEPSTFYWCWLLKKLLLLLLTKISIVRVKKNTATSCQCCVVLCCSSVQCLLLVIGAPTSENRVSMLNTMQALMTVTTHIVLNTFFTFLYNYIFLPTPEPCIALALLLPRILFLKNNCGKYWDRGMAARKERGQNGETVEKVDKKHLEI